MTVEVKVSNKLKEKLNDAKIRIAVDKAVTQTARELRDRLSMNPTPKITGNLRRSNSYEVRRDKNYIEALIKNSANYWIYVNYGTSKRGAVHFVEQAVERIQPPKRIKEIFNENYKS